MADQARIDRLQANHGAAAMLARKLAERRSLEEEVAGLLLIIKLSNERLEKIQTDVVPIEEEIDKYATIVETVARGGSSAE